MSLSIQEAIEKEIRDTNAIFDTIKKSLDATYKVIEERNVALINQLKETFSGIVDNNASAKKFSASMSSALNELIATQQTLENKIKLAGSGNKVKEETS